MRISAVLPSSLHTLDLDAGRVSLPHLGHLTALTKLHSWRTVVTPAWGQLPPLPALQCIHLDAQYLVQDDVEAHWLGPQHLGLAALAPHLTEVSFLVGGCGVFRPHEQLAALAPLAQLKSITLDFGTYHHARPEQILPSGGLLSLPLSVTKLILWDFYKCLPAVAVPDNVAVVHICRPAIWFQIP